MLHKQPPCKIKKIKFEEIINLLLQFTNHLRIIGETTIAAYLHIMYSMLVPIHTITRDSLSHSLFINYIMFNI